MRERPILFSGSMVLAILAGRKTQTRRPVKNLRVRLRHDVSSDLPAFVRPPIVYQPGTYAAAMNPQGAVHVTGPAGDLGVKPQEFDFLCPYADGHTYLRKHPDGRMVWHLQVPAGQRLWVRETWFEEFDPITAKPYDPPRACYQATHEGEVRKTDGDGGTVYRKDGYAASPWRPGIHMPRWASRLLLEVTEVRVERLHAITEEDARAEGMEPFAAICPDQRMPVTGERYGDAPHRGTFMCRWDAMYEDGPFGWRANPWVWVVSFRRVEAARSAA